MQLKNILISRVDNIGDVILTLPLAGILKEKIPGVKISFLARNYVRAIVAHCVHIDAFYSWDALSHMDSMAAVLDIQSKQFDAVIHVSPNPSVAALMRKAGIAHRIGTARRWFHWLTCNHRVNFSRAQSTLHEAQLNTKLLEPLSFSIDDNLENLAKYVGLCGASTVSSKINTFLQSDKFNLIVHPFSNGNAREWPISHFNALIRRLPTNIFNVIVTGSSKEALTIEQRMIAQLPHITNAAGQLELEELLQLLSQADGVIANSTGPLHMAAALGRRTLGLFPISPGMTATRWRPLGENVTTLEADPHCTAPACRYKNDCFCMESIKVDAVKSVIMDWAGVSVTGDTRQPVSSML